MVRNYSPLPPTHSPLHQQFLGIWEAQQPDALGSDRSPSVLCPALQPDRRTLARNLLAEDKTPPRQLEPEYMPAWGLTAQISLGVNRTSPHAGLCCNTPWGRGREALTKASFARVCAATRDGGQRGPSHQQLLHHPTQRGTWVSQKCDRYGVGMDEVTGLNV